jgi:hypothetical protein
MYLGLKEFCLIGSDLHFVIDVEFDCKILLLLRNKDIFPTASCNFILFCCL